MVHAKPLTRHTIHPPEFPKGKMCVCSLEKSRKEDECPTLNFSAKKTGEYSINKRFCQGEAVQEDAL
ncbi:MAG TPA: hypothetical protein DIS59_04810 [Candidatus Magasanikbacteria bacterium]|nr:hypothetical protein [Candidatus Magasanikbacteria bacterium]HCM54225.1 hypothetical protein [Candidatus Magasanikbacteria bacterium]